MPEDMDNWQRIVTYALGECTAEEAVQTRAWIDADPERKALADELIQLADAGPTAIFDAPAAWERFHGAIEPLQQHDAVLPLSRKRRDAGRTSAGRWLMAAAAAFLLLASSAVIWQATRAPAGTVIAADDLRAVTTRPGQTAEIYLSDGTRVLLGAASVIRFPERFGRSRDVFLEGVAYFDVAPDDGPIWRRNRQFAVHTEGAVSRDIGTQFSVRAYAGDATEVVVAEGAVALAHAASAEPAYATADSLLLGPGDLGRLDSRGDLTVTRGVDVAAHHAWMQGRLIFANAAITDVIAQFRHWYGLELQLGDSSLAAARVTAAFDTGSPSAALDLMSAVLDVRIVRSGDTAVLYRSARGR